MNSESIHEGGCLCGAVRYRTVGEPVRAMACHCGTCRRRSGSVFAVGVYFEESQVTITQGELRSYEFHSSESGRWFRNEFCVQCGSTVTWTLEMRPGIRGVAGGSFDDHHWFDLSTHIWTENARADMRYADHVDVVAKALPAPAGS